MSEHTVAARAKSVNCPVCGSPFSVKKYPNKKTCSRQCGQLLRFRSLRVEFVPLTIRSATAVVWLGRGRYSLIDAVDWRKVAPFKWYLDTKGYAVRYWFEGNRTLGRRHRATSLHFVIAGLAGVDHRDLDPLNNRKSNLRPATRLQQSGNQGLKSNNKSGVRGVFWDRRRNKWVAKICANGVEKTLGAFDSLDDAAKVRREAALAVFGEFCREAVTA